MNIIFVEGFAVGIPHWEYGPILFGASSLLKSSGSTVHYIKLSNG